MPSLKRTRSILKKDTHDSTELDASPEHAPPEMWDAPTKAQQRPPLLESAPGLAVRDDMLAVHGAPLAGTPLLTDDHSPTIQSSPAPRLSNLGVALARIGLAVADLAPSTGTATLSPASLHEPPSRAPPSSPKPLIASDGAHAPGEEGSHGAWKRRTVPQPVVLQTGIVGGGSLPTATRGEASQGTGAGATAPPGGSVSRAPSAESAGSGGRGGVSLRRQSGGWSRSGSRSPSRGSGDVAGRAVSFGEGGGAGVAGVGKEGQNPLTPSEQGPSVTPKASKVGAVGDQGGDGAGTRSAVAVGGGGRVRTPGSLPPVHPVSASPVRKFISNRVCT